MASVEPLLNHDAKGTQRSFKKNYRITVMQTKIKYKNDTKLKTEKKKDFF